MPKQQTLDTPENWGAASQGYADKVAPVLMQPFTDAFVDRLDLSPNVEALEVGAGSGAITVGLYRHVKSLLATDFAPDMVKILRERMLALGVQNVSCEVMDGQALELDDCSFDAVACGFALMLFPDRQRGFSELRRVLRPGGRAVISGWAGPDKFEVFGLLIEAMKAAFPDMPPAPPPPVFSLANPQDFKREMEGGGFRDVDVEFVSRELEIKNFEEMWETLTVGAPPVRVLLDRVGPQGQEKLYEALRHIIENRFGHGSIKLTNAATVAKGIALGK